VAIYRPKQPRWRLAVPVGLVALAVGFGLGWGLRGDDPPDPVEALSSLRSTLTSAAGTLEVVDVEYRESVRDGEVVNESEYDGARAALQRSRQRYLGGRSALLVLDRDLVTSADALYSDIERLVDERAPTEEVTQATGDLADLLTGAVGRA
jgi:hypothetical protein